MPRQTEGPGPTTVSAELGRRVAPVANEQSVALPVVPGQQGVPAAQQTGNQWEPVSREALLDVTVELLHAIATENGVARDRYAALAHERLSRLVQKSDSALDLG